MVEEYANQLPHWPAACRLILLIQPSSAAAERVFSLLTNSFSEQQTSALEDSLKFPLCFNTIIDNSE